MTGRIVVFGATGYTREMTARALVARGASPVLAAGSPERLERLADELGGLETRVARYRFLQVSLRASLIGVTLGGAVVPTQL